MDFGIPVALCACNEYAATPHTLRDAVDTALTLAGFAPKNGDRILVKPNLLRAQPLACTDPQVVRVACQWLLDHGVSVSVGDSPGFGTATGVAEAIGLTHALRDLRDAFGNSVRIVPQKFNGAEKREIPGIGSIRIARQALEADGILSIPRLKAHGQMGVTLSVKNLFGCVPGIEKAIAHARHGDKGPDGNNMPRLVAALPRLLPPQCALIDAVTTMSVHGPSKGTAYQMGLIAAASCCAAADTAIYTLLGLSPKRLPLWRAVQEAALPGAFFNEISLCGDDPGLFPFSGFIVPGKLSAHSFAPLRLLASTVRRLWAAATH